MRETIAEIYEALALRNRQRRTMETAKKAEVYEEKARQTRLNETVVSKNIQVHIDNTRAAIHHREMRGGPRQW